MLIFELIKSLYHYYISLAIRYEFSYVLYVGFFSTNHKRYWNIIYNICALSGVYWNNIVCCYSYGIISYPGNFVLAR